ncbi:PAS domain S-box protein [bacterium]|nr:PAS domain S-box protein [bacterium]
MKIITKSNFLLGSAGLLVLVILSIFYFITSLRTTKSQIEFDLKSVASGKVEQLDFWRSERLADANVLLIEDKVFTRIVRDHLKNNDQALKSQISNRFTSLISYYNYHNIFIADFSGKQVFGLNHETIELEEEALLTLHKSINERKPLLTPIHLDQAGDPHFGVIVPLLGELEDNNAENYGIVMQLEASIFIDNLLSSWPVTTESAEALMVRKKGDQVQFLTQLRFQERENSLIQIPLANQDLPAAKAIKGQTGFVEGKDYRNIEVYAYLYPVPNSPWFLITKIDKSEALQTWRHGAMLVFSMLIGVLILFIVAIKLIIQRRESKYYKTLLDMEVEKSESEARFTQLIEASPVPQAFIDGSGKLVYWNDSFQQMFGYTHEDIPTLEEWWLLAYPDEKYRKWVLGNWNEAIEHAAKNNTAIKPIEYNVTRKDGSVLIAEISGVTIGDSFLATFADMTERRKAEEELRQSKLNFESLYRAVPASIWDEDWTEVIELVNSLKKENISNYKEYFESHHDFVNECLSKVKITDVNDETLVMFEAKSKEDMLQSLATVFNTPDTYPGFIGELVALANGKTLYKTEMDLNTVTGNLITFLLSMTFPDENDNSGRVIVALTDISELKKSEEQLKQSEDKFRKIFEKSRVGKSLTTPDGRLLQINTTFAEMLGYTKEEMENINFAEITHPDDIAESKHCIQTLLAGERDDYTMKKRYMHKNGEYIWASVGTYLLRDSAGAPVYFITSILNINDLVRLNDALDKSNKELEQFAYVASHDLQEPLRMVASYTQLLELKYKDKLDEKAGVYIKYAVDGAKRMQGLINDLLLLSRVGTKGKPFEISDGGIVVDMALENLQKSIEESNAIITVDELPEIYCDVSQLVQVFQNLISNAIKFRGNDPPSIVINAKEMGAFWEFSVKDNGIGFEMEYKDRIFQVFQRLNERDKYAGSGIGLSIVKKIVERHDGKLWVESVPGNGSCFYFTLPIMNGRGE